MSATTSTHRDRVTEARPSLWRPGLTAGAIAAAVVVPVVARRLPERAAR
jgi:hypothetical protein